MNGSHVYILTENFGLSADQWLAVVALTDDLEQHGSSQPAHNNHKRTRLDGDAIISESDFNPNSIRCQAIRARVGVALGIAPGQLDLAEDAPVFGSVSSVRCAVSQDGNPLVDMVIFAGDAAAWEVSRQEVVAYLKANEVEWEGV